MKKKKLATSRRNKICHLLAQKIYNIDALSTRTHFAWLLYFLKTFSSRLKSSRLFMDIRNWPFRSNTSRTHQMCVKIFRFLIFRLIAAERTEQDQTEMLRANKTT